MIWPGHIPFPDHLAVDISVDVEQANQLAFCKMLVPRCVLETTQSSRASWRALNSPRVICACIVFAGACDRFLGTPQEGHPPRIEPNRGETTTSAATGSVGAAPRSCHEAGRRPSSARGRASRRYRRRLPRPPRASTQDPLSQG